MQTPPITSGNSIIGSLPAAEEDRANTMVATTVTA